MVDLLQLEGISKGFSGVPVLKSVDFSVRAGSVVGLAGENGAGKSTLMKIISGIYPRDAGIMRVRGIETTFTNPRQAMNGGIAIIHQELNLLPELTVAENIFLGREPLTKTGLINKKAMIDKSLEVLERLKQAISPNTKISQLSIAQQQMVEIAKALSFDADVIIMDEPTDTLTDAETEKLFAAVEDLRRDGKGIVFISHRLGEVFRLCDQIAILRDGEMVHQSAASEINEDTLIRHMVGRELSEQYPYQPAKPGDIRVKVTELSAPGISDISFEARAGEVVGFAGLMGAGRTELAKALFGANPATSGKIEIDGKQKVIRVPGDGVKARIGYVTEDRKAEGLIQMHSVRSNMTLAGLKQFLSRFLSIDRKAEAARVDQFIDRFSIKTHHQETQISLLSGGNQQKVAIAKALIPGPEILILDEPTRGVDVGAKREIYTVIQDLKAKGLCILLMSSDIPELLGISDRILVMARGKLTGQLDHENATQEDIMRAAVL